MKVAFHKIEITPEQPIGEPLGGYSRLSRCTGVHDPIFVYGMLMDIAGQHYLFLSYDMTLLPGTFYRILKSKIEHKFSIPTKNIFGHATHTHHTPDYTGIYRDTTPIGMVKGLLWGQAYSKGYNRLINKTIQLVDTLLKTLEPCKVAWTQKVIEQDLVINRRHPQTRVKKPLRIISFRDPSLTQNLGLMINYGAHGTAIGNQNNLISADWPGSIATRLNQVSENSIKHIFFNDANGSINPLVTCGTDFDYLEQHTNEVYEQQGDFKHSDKIGFFIADEALRMENSLSSDQFTEFVGAKIGERNLNIPIIDTWSPITCKNITKFLNNRLLFMGKKYLMLPIMLVHPHNKFTSTNITKNAKKNRYEQHTTIHMVRFLTDNPNKSLYFIGNPGEPFESIATETLGYLPQKENAFYIEQCDDSIAYNYFLDEYMEGGYENSVSYSPVAGQYILSLSKWIITHDLS